MADGSGPLVVLHYLAFVALALVAPGVGMQRLCRVRWDPALVLPLGLSWGALAHWLSLVSGRAFVFPLLCLPWLVACAWPPLPRRAEGPSLRGALVPIAVLAALFALTQYRVNRVDGRGVFLLDLGEHVDTALHVGLTFELRDGYPPQVPGLAGVPMRYHVGSHLVRAAALRWAGVHPYDAISRFDITLWAIALVLALRALAQAVGLGGAAVALAGFVPLACDLSLLAGLLDGVRWWAFKLGGNFLEPVFYGNSIVPALAIALAALVALARCERGEGTGFLALASLLCAGAGFFKVFVGAQLLLALAVAWLLGLERRRLAVVALPAAAALLLLSWSSATAAGGGVAVRLAPFPPLAPALRALSLPEVHGPSVLAWGLLWLVLSLGLRLVGIPAAALALRDRRASAVALAALALGGWPLASILSITADPAFEEGTYLLQASGVALWLFALPTLALLAGHGGPLRRRTGAAVVGVGVAVALAPTLEFVLRKAAQPAHELPASAVRAMSALRSASCPGDVVVTRPLPRAQWVPLPMVLAGRRVAFSNYLGYWRQFVPAGTLARRDRMVRSFFRAPDGEAARAIARELGAGYAYLTGPQQVDFDPRGVLEPVFDEQGERVYRVHGGAPLHCAPNAR